MLFRSFFFYMAPGLGCLMEQLRHVPIVLEVNDLADWGIQTIKEPCYCLLRELMHIRSDTTGARIGGTPQILRGIWAHIYPGSPSPRFFVYRDRQPVIPDRYICNVTLSSGGSDTNNVTYTFSSEACVSTTQSILEVSSKAIIALHHRDPEMGVLR